MPPSTPGNHTHDQWLGLVQPVGLVVAPAVLSALQLFPNQSTAYLSARQRQLEGLLEEVESPNDQPPSGQPLAVVPSFALLATDLLDWGDADLLPFEQLPPRADGSRPEVVLAEYGESLRPTHGVPRFEGEGLQALVLDLTQWRKANGELDPQWGRDFDANWNPTGHGWDATPQQRFERLLKETEIPIGLLFNYTPRALTEPIVAEAFRPWLECCGQASAGRPTAEQILALKVCDPAMGSGAFLVAVCRYLAGCSGWRMRARWRSGSTTARSMSSRSARSTRASWASRWKRP